MQISSSTLETTKNITKAHPSKPLGKQLHILQINIEGISRAKGEVLSRPLSEHDVDVAVLQETHAESFEDLSRRAKIYEFTLAAAEFSRAHGIATYVKSSLTKDVCVVQRIQDAGTYINTIRIHNTHVMKVY